MKITTDYHVHTGLSVCAPNSTTIESYLPVIKEQGLTKIGIADHIWDDKIPGASKFYIPQTPAHSALIKEQGVPGVIDGVQFLFGCEADMNKDDVLGLTEESAAMFDFIIVSTAHFHMKGFTIENDTPVEVARKRMLERIYKAIEVPFISGIAHPFLPMGYVEERKELLSGITDNQLIDCFKAVADAKKSVEINFNYFAEKYAVLEETERIYTLAREQGCSFHLGSDCHKPEKMCGYEEAIAFAEKCGITEDRFIPLETLGTRG